jgi:phosphatidylglycerol:prolipoprotein diacylglycerol transferase
MRQVLFRIPTDTPWFVWLGVLAFLLLGGGAWLMTSQTRDRRGVLRELLVYLGVAGVGGFFLLRFLASRNPEGIPIYGYGLMLFVTFLACTWLAGRLGRREGIEPEHLQDLALYLFVGGIVGSRVVFWLQYPEQIKTVWDFFAIWNGGLVFYGGLVGGVVGYLAAYRRVILKNGISGWKVADVAAPCAALGLALGRVGCLLNGCCYGDVACPHCPAVTFPLSGMPRAALVERGSQTAAGFTLVEGALHLPAVGAVEPGSPAEGSGLRAGDVIVAADGLELESERDLWDHLGPAWPRGKNDLQLTVLRGEEQVELPPFRPRTLGLHPTQIYETVSAGLLFLLLMAYYPLRRHDGEVMALFLLLYPVHRFLNEMLRSDTEPVAFGLTLSQNGSVLVFAVGLVLLLWLRRMPPQYGAGKKEPAAA